MFVVIPELPNPVLIYPSPSLTSFEPLQRRNQTSSLSQQQQQITSDFFPQPPLPALKPNTSP
jgi:hypothetical protein